MANFKILLTVPMFDNQGNLQGIEDFIVAAYTLLAASNLVFNITKHVPGIMYIYLTFNLANKNVTFVNLH